MRDRQATAAAQLIETREIRRSCTRFLAGHPSGDPAEEYGRLAAWIRDNDAAPDVYGRGVFLQAFERKVADLLGKEAGLFVPTGTMAQQIALRIWADRAGEPRVAMHPTSHVELHEHRAYAHLHRLQGVPLGSRHRPTLASDLAAVPEPLSSLLVELPLREIGGRLPSWEELRALHALAAERGIRTHLDGARLWETRTFFGGRSYAEICGGFDSVYVSFYKGIGALGGALLAGPGGFIDEARVWVRRHGGNLYQIHPIAASAAMHFDRRVGRMPEFFARARELADAISKVDGVAVHPSPPHVNMFHVHLPLSPEAAQRARTRVAKEDRIWLFAVAHPVDTPGRCYFEAYIGENALTLDPAEAASSVEKLLR